MVCQRIFFEMYKLCQNNFSMKILSKNVSTSLANKFPTRDLFFTLFLGENVS